MTTPAFSHLLVEETRHAHFVRVLDAQILDDFEIREELFWFIHSDKAFLMLDLAKLKSATASFLATLVKLHVELHKTQRRMLVYNLTREMAEVFRNARLNKYLEIFEREDDAFQMLQRAHC